MCVIDIYYNYKACQLVTGLVEYMPINLYIWCNDFFQYILQNGCYLYGKYE